MLAQLKRMLGVSDADGSPLLLNTVAAATPLVVAGAAAAGVASMSASWLGTLAPMATAVAVGGKAQQVGANS